MNKLEQAARQALEAGENAESVIASINASKHHKIIKDDEPCYWQREEWVKWALEEVLPQVTQSITALREALDHIADTGKLILQFIPVGIVNDHHSITWMEEIVDDQAPIGAILYALQDGAGRNVSIFEEAVCNWRQPTYDHSDANYWDADCGKSWAITEGTPTDNGMNFCHGCGKPIKEHPFVDSEDE